MNNETPNPSNAAALAGQLVTLLQDCDAETRRRAIHAALTLLGDTPAAVPAERARHQFETTDDQSIDIGEFFARAEPGEPADNLYACAAFHFAKNGLAPFSVKDLQDIADRAGVILPNRPDMTLRGAGGKSKRMFQPAGRGKFRPTAQAGIWFRERFGVGPGRRADNSEEESSS